MSARIKVACTVQTKAEFCDENGPSLTVDSEALWIENVKITLGKEVAVVRGRDLILAIQNAMNCE